MPGPTSLPPSAPGPPASRKIISPLSGRSGRAPCPPGSKSSRLPPTPCGSSAALTRGQADYAAVHAIQEKYILTPLSAWGKNYSPPAGSVDPSVDMKTPPVKQVAKMTAATFFQTLAQGMKHNPPAPADALAVKKFTVLGLVPGKDFNPAKLKPAALQALEAWVKQGQKRIEDKLLKIGVMKNGWQTPSPPMGAYGADYEQRAAIAFFGLGANLREAAVYPTAYSDQEDQPLTGKHRYVL